MKRLLALIAAAAVGVALYATTATGGHQAVTPAQFAALKKQVTQLQKRTKDLETIAGFTIACAFNKGAVPITTAPAMHVTATGEAPTFYALTTIDAECVRIINSPTALKRLKASLRH
jgi:uncharacterized secreted protein with C-terminal beta-propeller domain